MRAFVWQHEYGAKTVWIADSVEQAQEMQRKRSDCDNKERNSWGYQIAHEPPSFSVGLPCHMSILDGSVYHD